MAIDESDSVCYQAGDMLFETIIDDIGRVLSDAIFHAGLDYEYFHIYSIHPIQFSCQPVHIPLETYSFGRFTDPPKV